MLYPSESLPDLASLEAFITRLAQLPDRIYHDIFCVALHASLSVDKALKLTTADIDANGSISVRRGRDVISSDTVELDARSLDIVTKRTATAIGGVLFPSPVNPNKPISKATVGNAWTAVRRQLNIKSKGKADPFTESQAQAFRAQLQSNYSQIYVDIWDVQMATQQRISDVLPMNANAISVNDKKWAFKTKKNAKVQRIEIIGGARPVITRRLNTANNAKHPWLFPSPTKPEKAITARSVGRVFKKVGEELGLAANCGCHTPRKTGAKLLYLAGEDIAVISKLLAHSNIETTMSYLGITDADTAAARADIADML